MGEGKRRFLLRQISARRRVRNRRPKLKFQHGLIQFGLAVFAIFGIFSAYLFGLTSMFGFGVRTLLDLEFASNALLSLVIYLAGIAAIVRFSYMVASVAAPTIARSVEGRISKKNEKIKMSRRWIVLFVVLILIIIVQVAGLFVILTATFLDKVSALLLFLVSASFIGVSAWLVRVIENEGPAVEASSPISGERHYRLISIWAISAKSVAVIVACLLVLSLFFGVARFHSLSNAKPLCILTDYGKFTGAIIGATKSGIIWIAEPISIFSTGLIGSDRATVNYLDRTKLVEIRVDCPKPE